MICLSNFASKSLAVAGIGLTSLIISFPATAQDAETPSIAEIASSGDSFDVLESLLAHAGILGAFDGSNGKVFTVFAPTDDAFGRLPKGTNEQPRRKRTGYRKRTTPTSQS